MNKKSSINLGVIIMITLAMFMNSSRTLIEVSLATVKLFEHVEVTNLNNVTNTATMRHDIGT